jgi:hypothetical protein
VLAPRLHVAVRRVDEAIDTVEPGQEFDVAVTVSALGAGGGDLSSLAFVDGVLHAEPEDRVAVVSGPTPVPPASFALPPGEAESFVVRLRAETLGPVTLSASRARTRTASPSTRPGAARFGWAASRCASTS